MIPANKVLPWIVTLKYGQKMWENLPETGWEQYWDKTTEPLSCHCIQVTG